MATALPAEDLGSPPLLLLAGHPLRWRLLRELARSDRRVQELTALTGEPQSLVSYHLGQLRKAGLVSARRSSADRRDAYYTVDLTRVRDLLVETGPTLHPGLRLAIPPLDTSGPRSTRARLLFLCTGNSARSQMAEALAGARSGGLVEARSAGSHPKPLHPNAVRVMREEHGVDMAGWRSKHLRTFTRRRFDRVVSLCDRVREVCPDFPGHPELLHWSIADPAAGHDPGDDAASYPTFQRTAAELATRLEFLLAALLHPPASSPSPTPTRRKEHP